MRILPAVSAVHATVHSLSRTLALTSHHLRLDVLNQKPKMRVCAPAAWCWREGTRDVLLVVPEAPEERWDGCFRMCSPLGPHLTHPLLSVLLLDPDWRLRVEAVTQPWSRDALLPEQLVADDRRRQRSLNLSTCKA